MILNKIEASNFGPYEDISIDLSGGLTAIVGPNGTGKSTLTEIVSFCCVGDIIGTKKDAIRDEGPQNGWARIRFTLNGLEGEIYKELHTSSAYMKYGNDEVEGVDTVNTTLLAALEIEKQTITDVVFAQQGELTRILFQRASERERMFHRIFGLERLPRIEKLLSNDLAKYGVVEGMDGIRQQVKKELESIGKEISEVTSAYERRKEGVGNANIEGLQQEYYAAQEGVGIIRELVTTKKQLEEILPVIEAANTSTIEQAEITNLEQRVIQTHDEITRLEASITQNTRVLRVLSADIANCPVCNTVLADPTALQQKFESMLSDATLRVSTLSPELSSLRNDLADITRLKNEEESTLIRLKTNQQDLVGHIQKLVKKAPTTIPDVDQVKARLQQVLNATQELTALNAKLTTLRERSMSLTLRMKDLETELEKGKRIREYLNVLEPTRKAFHYSKIPRTAATYYLDTLNALVNKYMGWFTLEFTAIITPTYEIKCGVGTTIRKSIRLSGGQKTILALALRLALHEMFAHSFGFLWLDEPTVFLDGKNVEMFCEVLDTVKSAAQSEMGTSQLFIITHHHTEVVPYADNVIDVEQLTTQGEKT